MSTLKIGTPHILAWGPRGLNPALMCTTATTCWPGLQTTWPTGYNASWMQQRELFRVLASSTGVYHLSYKTISTGSTFQSVSTASRTLLCIAARGEKLRGNWPTVARQFRKSPAVDNYAQPVDDTLQCHVTGWARSGAGPFRSTVLLRGTLYWIVSVIEYWVLTVLGNYLQGNYWTH